jgi:hypothetical protein
MRGHPFSKSISLEEMNSREKAQKAQKRRDRRRLKPMSRQT